jgi:hypothetical protein
MKLTKLAIFEEQVFFITVRIVSRTKDGKGASVGTGFLYQTHIDDKRQILLLVSNKHVLFGAKDISMLFHQKMKGRRAPILGETHGFKIPEQGKLYFEHPDSDVDLACINVSAVANDKQNKVFIKYLHDSMLSRVNEEKLHAGQTVWFIGYPQDRFDIKHNLPILRAGTIASLPRVDFNGKKQFIIDAQVFPGSSGSPVFALVEGQYKLIGVVSQTMIRNNQIQTVPAALALASQEVLGLGIVVKASALEKMFRVIRSSKQFKIKSPPQAKGES